MRKRFPIGLVAGERQLLPLGQSRTYNDETQLMGGGAGDWVYIQTGSDTVACLRWR